MKLASKVTTLKREGTDLNIDERAAFLCGKAKQLEKAGEYEAAREALLEFWPEGSELPTVEGLNDSTKGEVLLRAGAMTGWLGSAQQANDSQEKAKNLITQSIEIFETLRQFQRVAEARGDLALCYWREGAFDDARVTLVSALTYLENDDTDLHAILLIRAGMVEMDSVRLNDAFRFFNEAKPLVEQSENDALKGSFHMEFALLLRRLATSESREAYIDQALIENAAASFYHERAGNYRYLARVENNLGYLLFTIGQYQDAHNHLDRARHLFLDLKDIGTSAQVDETRARVFLAEGRLKDAERVIRSSVKTLEKGGEQALLAEALTTQGVVQARLRNHAHAKVILQRAVEVAQTAGDQEGAGRAQLSIIEELSAQTTTQELALIYESAADLLHRSQDPSSGQRLIACARKLINLMAAEERTRRFTLEQDSWEGFSLKREIRRIEKAAIERALRDAGGSVSKAAHLLGFKHHQSLIILLNNRHSDLQGQRSVVRKRRRHLFSEARRSKRTNVPNNLTGEAVAILHVEDNKPVARLVRDTLAADGMHVDSCINGLTALEILKSSARYQALVVDNNLPGLSGLELILRVRSMSQRANLPIIMLSGADCEKEAWRAGVDAFLLKPQAVNQLASTINRVMRERRKNVKQR